MPRGVERKATGFIGDPHPEGALGGKNVQSSMALVEDAQKQFEGQAVQKKIVSEVLSGRLEKKKKMMMKVSKEEMMRKKTVLKKKPVASPPSPQVQVESQVTGSVMIRQREEAECKTLPTMTRDLFPIYEEVGGKLSFQMKAFEMWWRIYTPLCCG